MPASCYNHWRETATSRCCDCSQFICAHCVVHEGGSVRCPQCVELHAQGSRSRKLLVLSGVSLAVLLVGGAYLAGLFPPGLLPELAKRAAALTEPGFDYGTRSRLVSKLRYELEQEPCDRTRAAQYAQTVFAASDWRGSIQFTDDFIARCGKFPQLRSISYSAHMRLREFDLAIRDATELIDSAPRNAGYWIWRSMAHRARGQVDPAMSDLEQAFRVQPEQLSVARQLAYAYEQTGRLGDAHRVLMEHQRVRPASSRQAEVKEWVGRLADQGVGREKGTEVVASSNMGKLWLESRVNDKVRGRFAFDAYATTVAISRAFADRLGLKLDGARLRPFQTANGLIKAPVVRLRSLAVHENRVENIEVAVMSTLPPDMDGVLGTGFLAGYEVDFDVQTAQLKLSKRKR